MAGLVGERWFNSRDVHLEYTQLLRPWNWFSKNSPVHCFTDFYRHMQRRVCSPRLDTEWGPWWAKCPAAGHTVMAEWDLLPPAGLSPPFPVAVGRSREVYDRNPLLKTSGGKKEGNTQRDKAVQSSFAMRPPAATCPLYRPINRGRGRKPAASSSACALSKAKFQGLRGQSLLGRCQLSAHTIIVMPKAKVVKKQGPGLCMGICLRDAPLLWHLFSFQGLGNVPLKAISNLHAKH